ALLRPPRSARPAAKQFSDSSVLHFKNALDLDGHAAGQRAGADGAAGADAGLVAEHLGHQLREAVDDLRLVAELRRAQHQPERLDEPLDLVERAERVL